MSVSVVVTMLRPDLYVYVKWILWRDNMIDKLRRKIR